MHKRSRSFRIGRLEGITLRLDSVTKVLEQIGELKLAREVQLLRSDILKRALNIERAPKG